MGRLGGFLGRKEYDFQHCCQPSYKSFLTDSRQLTYGSAAEAAEDLKKRGFSIDWEKPAGSGVQEKV